MVKPELQGGELELGKDCTLFETIVQPMQIFFDIPLANNANMPILIVEVEFMETLLDRLDRLQFAMWKADCEDEAARNLGTVIDCARQDLEDPDNDVDAGGM